MVVIHVDDAFINISDSFDKTTRLNEVFGQSLTQFFLFILIQLDFFSDNIFDFLRVNFVSHDFIQFLGRAHIPCCTMRRACLAQPNIFLILATLYSNRNRNNLRYLDIQITEHFGRKNKAPFETVARNNLVKIFFNHPKPLLL